MITLLRSMVFYLGVSSYDRLQQTQVVWSIAYLDNDTKGKIVLLKIYINQKLCDINYLSHIHQTKVPVWNI